MNKMKYGILGLGAAGMISLFLPFDSFGDESVSLWTMYHSMTSEWGLWDTHPYTHLAMCLIAVVMAGIGLSARPGRWQALVSVLAFSLAAANLGSGFYRLEALTERAIGGNLMWIAVAGGLVLSLLAVIKPAESPPPGTPDHSPG